VDAWDFILGSDSAPVVIIPTGNARRTSYLIFFVVVKSNINPLS